MDKKCKIISVYSPKGGAGVSTVSINLAAALAYETKQNVLLLSIHTHFIKDLTSFFDMDFKYYFSRIPMDKLTEKLIPAYVNPYSFKKIKFHILPFLKQKEDAAKIKLKGLEKFLNYSKNVFDYIIINTPNQFNKFTIPVFDFSNLILLLTAPAIPSIVKIKESLLQFREYLYPPELIKLVLNNSNIKGALKKEEIKDAINNDIFFSILHDQEELINAEQVGKPVVELNPKSKFSNCMMHLAQILDKGHSEDDEKSLFSVVSEIVKNKRKKIEEPPEDASSDSPQKALQQYNEVKQHIHNKLVVEFNINATDLEGDKLESETRKVVERLLAEEKKAPSERDERELLVKEILEEALGLGPLDALLKDKDVTEIMVNCTGETYIEKHGKLQITDIKFLSDQQLLKFCERIVAPLGRRIDESSPYVDARLPDGSRVHIIIPPLALKGPTITILKFSKEKLGPDDLLKFGTAVPEMLQFLKWCVLVRKNIIISGGTGAGKTTLLNIVSGFIPEDERIVTVEDSAELQLQQPHWVRLESRPASIEGTGQVTIRDLVKCCLRMRPDRIVVGECRGGEALDMLQAMNTGHDGSLTTVHSNSPRDCIRRLETLCLMSGMELPARAIREQVAGATDLIVQQARLSDGSRKIINIAEVTGMEGDVVTLQDIFIYKQTSVDKEGKVIGQFKPTGVVPSFLDELKSHGIKVDHKIFRPKG